MGADLTTVQDVGHGQYEDYLLDLIDCFFFCDLDLMMASAFKVYKSYHVVSCWPNLC